MVDCKKALEEAKSRSEAESALYVEASQSRNAVWVGDLSFSKGDMIRVEEKGNNFSWKGTVRGKTGFFPANLIKPEKEISGELFYKIGATFLEVALQKDLFADLMHFWKSILSEDGLKAFLSHLESLINRAADIMGEEYGLIVREAFSNVKYAARCDHDFLSHM
jgi:Variant SH3 domain